MKAALVFIALAASLIGAAVADSGTCTCTCTSGTPTSTDCTNLASFCSSAGGTPSTCTTASTSFTCSFGSKCVSDTDCQSGCSLAIGCTAGSAATTCSSSSSKCFPANATVQLEDGTVKTMSQLKKGDRVLVSASGESVDGTGTYSDIYMFSHQDPTAESDFVQIVTASGASVRLTPDHYLYVNGKLAVAKTVRLGDTVSSAGSASDKVVKVGTVRATGLYNPHTLHGDIVVDGVRTSIYTSSIAPALAHAALFPVRMAYQLGQDLLGDAFAQGSDLIANSLPDGKEAY